MNDITIMDIVFYIIVVVIVALVTCGLATLEKEQSLENEKWLQVVEECQHDYAITSKYNFLVGRYKTISKCTKCGYEVE